MKALDYMIANNLFEYSTDTWGSDERTQNYNSVEAATGQVNYKDEIFVVTHSKGGGAGMGAYPDSVNILRIQPVVKVELVEFEAGWGQRVDEVKEFPTKELAEEFVDKFNEGNNEARTPEWYMIARIIS